MARSFNNIVLLGYAGRDPESRTLPDGSSVCSFSIATNERKRGEEEQATWFRISVFGPSASFASQYIRKGSYVYVQGSLSQQEYQGRDGTQKSSLEVRARDVQLLDKREDGASDGRGRPNKAEVSAAAAVFDDDVPFHHKEESVEWQLDF